MNYSVEDRKHEVHFQVSSVRQSWPTIDVGHYGSRAHPLQPVQPRDALNTRRMGSWSGATCTRGKWSGPSRTGGERTSACIVRLWPRTVASVACNANVCCWCRIEGAQTLTFSDDDVNLVLTFSPARLAQRPPPPSRHRLPPITSHPPQASMRVPRTVRKPKPDGRILQYDAEKRQHLIEEEQSKKQTWSSEAFLFSARVQCNCASILRSYWLTIERAR